MWWRVWRTLFGWIDEGLCIGFSWLWGVPGCISRAWKRWKGGF